MPATAKAPPVPAKADYGLDAPRVVRRMLVRGVLLFGLGAGLWFMNRDMNPRGGSALFSVLGSMGAAFLLTGVVMVWSSRTGKLAMRDRILDSIEWRGDEKVLDVGCGRGLMLIGAAKRLKTGKATGIDIWSAEDLSGNSAEAAIGNAKAEGVADKIKIENADARRLAFQANSFDIVLSSLAIHNISDSTERAKALDEMLRVVKPGGQIAVWDILHYGDYQKHFERAGAEVVKRSGLNLLWCMPSRWFVARKR